MLPEAVSGILLTRLPRTEKKRRHTVMLEPKDFATGCLTIIVGALLVPLFLLVFKLTLVLAIALAIATGIILGVTVLGRIVRLFFAKKEDQDN